MCRKLKDMRHYARYDEKKQMSNMEIVEYVRETRKKTDPIYIKAPDIEGSNTD